MNLGLVDLNKFQVKSSDPENPDQGIELQYNIAQGVNISIPVQKMAEVALGNARNAAERKMNEMYEEANGS